MWRGCLTRQQLIHDAVCPNPHAVSDIRHDLASQPATTSLFSNTSALVMTLPLYSRKEAIICSS